MRCSFLSAALAASAFLGPFSAISILLGNDDGFGSAQIREFYRLLKESGHQVVMVAPADNESSQGGRSVFTTNNSTSTPPGAPSLGRDPNDADIWYYNGTAAACTFVALDYVLPNFYSNRSIDLYVDGPNFGLNQGYFFYTLSGTIGGTFAAIQRNIPGVAFSGGDSEQRSYAWINKTTASGYPDPATIQAQLATNLANQLVNSSQGARPLMSAGFGLNVNTPVITSPTNDSCVNPPSIQTRLGGGATTDKAILITDGNNVCINGNCALPGETPVVDNGCYGSVSVFSIDYDAPMGPAQHGLRAALQPLVAYENPDAKMMLKARESMSREDAAARHPLRQA
ncbi:5'/3'-nucleotidase SurE [Cladophialophora bantiana CBS 173.52]|uniref:5'/3'-nucleotidase SurE n=1 Tax=Cladophialophora bantiana (strain ATCC 10958 / CBS 173.52 / CDC B-1940 / NIH 8579) TaxID=1442370 RepID=A0A0D2HW39_CLAB1|nr:5'/3'-nucleotidase SurE [Cladophialophora bantiana CBS 173.52]KIW95165.1 5'/3'-nucleotidase SurE [Cladophialophora bantiana CBS 173.52]